MKNANQTLRAMRKDIFRYVLLFPALIFTFVFSYLTMPGILVAFKKFVPLKGILKSPWAGLQNFRDIFTLPYMSQSILNTVILSVLTLIVCFPAPILFALMLNELRGGVYKRTIQTLTYLPYFLSWMALIGIAQAFYARFGPLNDILVYLTGMSREAFLARQSFFIPNQIILTLWKGTGFGTVIYLAAISGINPELYEAASVDGAGRLKQALHVTLPSILPTITMLLIFSIGGLLGSNFELVYGMQNAYVNFEVISTVVFKWGIQRGKYDFATAFGLFNGVASFILIYVANRIARKLSGVGIW